MVPALTVVFCVVTLLISLILPVAVLILMHRKYKGEKIIPAWLLGAAGFFVTQMLIRLPILTALQNMGWFEEFSRNHLFLYAFSLAFTAGLFELAGRFAVAKLLYKNLTYRRSLAAGLGHGSIEAMVLVGMTYVNNLIYIAMINSGAFDTLLAQTAAAGIDISQLELIRTQFLTMSPAVFLLAGYERLLTMAAQTAMSMIVCYGVARQKILPCLLACLGIHTLLDLTAGLSMVLPQNILYPVIYTILTAAAVISLLILRKFHQTWTETEVFHDAV